MIDDASAPLIANGVAKLEIEVELVALMRYTAQNDAIPVRFSLPLDVVRLKTRPYRDMGGKGLRQYWEEFPRKGYVAGATRTGY